MLPLPQAHRAAVMSLQGPLVRRAQARAVTEGGRARGRMGRSRGAAALAGSLLVVASTATLAFALLRLLAG